MNHFVHLNFSFTLLAAFMVFVFGIELGNSTTVSHIISSQGTEKSLDWLLWVARLSLLAHGFQLWFGCQKVILLQYVAPVLLATPILLPKTNCVPLNHLNKRELCMRSHTHFVQPVAWLSCLQGGCLFVALALHYLFLAAFCWMLCEGILLYLLLVVVFSTLSRRWWFFLLIGYGMH